MVDLAEFDSLQMPRGRPAWGATDAIFHPARGAVRQAASYYEIIKSDDTGPRNGRHERVIQQVIDYMTQKGFRLPNRESLENFLRRSRKTKRA